MGLLKISGSTWFYSWNDGKMESSKNISTLEFKKSSRMPANIYINPGKVTVKRLALVMASVTKITVSGRRRLIECEE